MRSIWWQEGWSAELSLQEVQVLQQLGSNLDRATNVNQILTLIEDRSRADGPGVLYTLAGRFMDARLGRIRDLEWQPVILIARLEIIRSTNDNKDLPCELREVYPEAVKKLVDDCLKAVPETSSDDLCRGFVALLLASRGFIVYSLAILEYSECELREFFLPDIPLNRLV